MGKEISKDLEQTFIKYYSAHREGRLSEAEKGYRKILKKKPDWGQVLSALGNLYLDKGKAGKAWTAFKKAADLNPPDLSACYNLGRLQQLENNHEKAISTYKKILNQKPDIGIVWNNLGVAYRETGEPDDAIESFQAAVKFAPEMAEAWNNLGVAQDESNLAESALNSYKKAIKLAPDYVSPHLNLGLLLQKSEHYEKAEKHYNKVLEVQPENDIAQFMLQSLGKGEETPDAVPVEHVRSIFDQCAENFEEILVQELEYKTPEHLFKLVRPFLTHNLTILDLGCGTGLGAQLYKPFANHLTGVDVSEKMLEKADEKNIYDRLELFDILQEWTFPEKFDLIYSSDVFVYFGDLFTILKSASMHLTDGGIMAFSVERLKNDTQDYRLYPSGRYAHSQRYIQQCLEQNGFKMKKICQADIRNQSGTPVKGLLVVAVR